MSAHELNLNQVIANTLAEGGFSSEKDATRELSLMIALSKVSRYERECSKFRTKYGQSLEEFQRNTVSINGVEVFEQEDDVMDWEFAENALTLWQRRLEVLRNDK